MTRDDILDCARSVVTGKREQDYGTPEDSFRAIAALWSDYLDVRLRRILLVDNLDGPKVALDPQDVALMMALLKIARLANTPAHADSWVDLAGYAACGASCVDDLAESS